MADEPGDRIAVSSLAPAQRREPVAVIARGMRDNPLHVAAFGEDPERRHACLQRMFDALFRTVESRGVLCAREGDLLVGATGVAPPGTCQPTMLQRIRMLPSVLAAGPASTRRVLTWLGAWAEHDPDEPHVHLGPLAVEPHLQGRGIGSRLLAEHCRRLDADRVLGYLETDKIENVPLYERFGYRTVSEARVLGVPNWFMRRDPHQYGPEAERHARPNRRSRAISTCSDAPD